METIASLTAKHANDGALAWIGIRPARREPVIAREAVTLNKAGLEGDHYQKEGKRTVTLIQEEHLSVIAALLGLNAVKPEQLRRNFVIRGINLIGLKSRRFEIGDAILEGTGICAPCSRMEEAFGYGGYTAVRGHGGITARIIKPGQIKIGDTVSAIK
ncbi:MAG: MOSC domain-containing protein [Pseudomonadota bacterium]